MHFTGSVRVRSEAADQSLKQQKLHVYLILCRPKRHKAASFFCRGTIPRTLSTRPRKDLSVTPINRGGYPTCLQLQVDSPQHCRVKDGEYHAEVSH